MNDLQKLWIAALRSDEYDQGSYILRSEYGKYCPLGVLCDLYDPSRWNKTKHGFYYRDKSFKDVTYLSQFMFTRPPFEVSDSVDMDLRKTNNIIHWNDVLGMSFNDIAKRLEFLLVE